MDKVYKYEIVKGYDTSLLENIIQSMIEKGWQPFGNLLCYTQDGIAYFVQAMVLYSPVK